MAGIRGSNTSPEMKGRKLLHQHGFRYRLHHRGLPGRADVVLARYKVCIFVHGRYWHRHPSCRYTTISGTQNTYNNRNSPRTSHAIAVIAINCWSGVGGSWSYRSAEYTGHNRDCSGPWKPSAIVIKNTSLGLTYPAPRLPTDAEPSSLQRSCLHTAPSYAA